MLEKQLERLRALVAFLQNESRNAFYQEKLSGVDPAAIRTLADLGTLPFTLKSELVAEQNNFPPFGRNLSYDLSRYTKLHQTSGTTGRPLRVPDTAESWNWWADCWTTVYRSAGINADDRIFFAFSFGPFIGFWAAYEGASRLGALALPGGGLDTEQRLSSIIELGATVLCCTPSYALYLAEVAGQKGFDIANSAVRVLVLAGEPGANIPATRQRIETAWNAKVHDHAGATEVGAWGYGSADGTGLHVNEDDFIAEVLEPGTNTPVPSGESGELVITNLGRWGYPVIRYRTGDMVQVGLSPDPANSHKFLLGGVIGRADNMVTVRGINIYPSSVEAIVREVLPTAEFRLIFFRENNLDELQVLVELDDGDHETLSQLESLFRQRLALRVPVAPVAPGSLPRFQLKARRIEDRRFEG
jgi:phenylacetate-CoA ligase